ncbi:MULTISPECIES: sulfatase [unclassified Lentimonas]|uniref:sulfatase n=1 Tax=unclassified Lentimonas TaxID=2630993 RepID=UPI0013234C7C|nr:MULTISPECIES: sulfatase [unclassified Lentimonas]CAA6676246.1 Unannotated [Lentimonas sp. CC4]CAA6683868.1 Unannotated [Lentimonas sp. CC6]CAA7077736.1 Unannotated [Lentimonas sp. CC4]CAA7171900.1 Unannotated [Lentimonas sp. CC21]CAA7183538.1 Unannotated [Lentimonas sp. CC8]
MKPNINIHPSIFRRFQVCLVAVCAISASYTVLSAQDRPEQPNFVMILADDLGWQDIKNYDTEAPYSVFETPYMDQMATEGTKFLQAYSPACVCAPSRAAILTGHHPARLNFTTVSGGTTVPQPSSLSSRMMDPYHTRRLELEQVTLPELLRSSGYMNGHIGKWHLEGDDPTQHGFDYSDGDRGVTLTLGDRTTGFTSDLDENGFAQDQTTDNAFIFMDQAVAADQPFFCYYASYLVHAPWHIRTERLLIKYAAKMGYEYPLTGDEFFAPGQNNPYYAAMVEMFDYNVHRIMTYLEETDDPRWPGHKLIENTYVFLTSDNGGMENGDPQGKVTDNYPLDQGKIFQEEGGLRVPFIAIGPGIAANTESEVMINGLDFMPTMLSLAGLTIPEGMDGCDISTLLLDDPQDPELVTDADDAVRDTMYWHFPNSRLNSTIRKSGWKLFRNYDYVNNASNNQHRLYELYDTNGDRVDIEEVNDQWDSNTAKTTELADELDAWLTEVGANIPSYNPNCTTPLPNQEFVPAVIATGGSGSLVFVEYETDKAAMARVDLLYTLNGGSGEVWFRLPATITELGHAEATVPEGTTHYVFNLIDENDFLVSYPDVGTSSDGLLDSSFALPYVELPYVNPAPQTTIFSEDFSIASLDKNGLKRDSVGFCVGSESAWTISSGKLSNSSLVNTTVSEGAAACIIDLSTLDDASVDQFTLSFDYTLAEANETLYVHVWGYVDHSSTATTSMINDGASNGNAWEKASPAYMTGYNFGNLNGAFIGEEGIAADAAVARSGFQGLNSYAKTFDLSEFTTAPSTLGAYDYLVLGFTRNFSGSAPAATIDNVKVTVPDSDGYVVWAHESGLNDATITADPDLDGIVNLLEYGLGGDPNQPDSGVLPSVEVDTEEINTLTFIYRRLQDDGESDPLTYTPKMKLNLSDSVWSSAGIVEVDSEDLGDAYEQVTCTVDTTGLSTVFIRLEVERLL